MKEERVHLAYRLPLSMIKERCGKTLPRTRMSELKLGLKETVYYLVSPDFPDYHCYMAQTSFKEQHCPEGSGPSCSHLQSRKFL